MVLMIDNYDSFTFNLVQYFQELGQSVLVKRHDEITITEIEALSPNHIVISPGPCSPNEAGISLEVVKAFAGKIPILGVCLGHQVIGQVFGSQVVRAAKVMHGKVSRISHTGNGLFKGLNDPLTVTRYHSLLIDKVPEDFVLTAWVYNENNQLEVMAMEHNGLSIYGVQFHPESILTEQGHQLLQNFLNA